MNKTNYFKSLIESKKTPMKPTTTYRDLADRKKLKLSASIQPKTGYINSTNPAHYDPVLFDCTFEDIKGSALKVRILDRQGQCIGTGVDNEQASWFAAKVINAQMRQPSYYDSLLEDCKFKIESKEGVATYKVVFEADGVEKIIGEGRDKLSAVNIAAINILRTREVANLSLEEFKRLCSVVTVDIIKNKTDNKCKLRPELYNLNSGILDLRNAIKQECRLLNIPDNDQVYWQENRLEEIMTAELKKGALNMFNCMEINMLFLEQRNHKIQKIALLMYTIH